MHVANKREALICWNVIANNVATPCHILLMRSKTKVVISLWNHVHGFEVTIAQYVYMGSAAFGIHAKQGLNEGTLLIIRTVYELE